MLWLVLLLFVLSPFERRRDGFPHWRTHVRTVENFVRDSVGCPFATLSHARQGEAQTPPLLDHWLVAKLCRFAVPSAFAFAVRVARDTVTRPIPGARPTGQRKRCSKTLPAFLSDATRAFAASMLLTRRSRSPLHSF
ncbi:hypothetical protein Dda3937_04407 [Dickeya dadantii 3937]|uniref:Uncharacterized protein n=1 Tax=Dickeya dadantii (strain 3937) TaxID=198628 RepID=E0SHY5_DICD3|nr:hypothetical protein Dda3937_04407 [Dickeya dadantii 3937]